MSGGQSWLRPVGWPNVVETCLVARSSAKSIELLCTALHRQLGATSLYKCSSSFLSQDLLYIILRSTLQPT